MKRFQVIAIGKDKATYRDHEVEVEFRAPKEGGLVYQVTFPSMKPFPDQQCDLLGWSGFVPRWNPHNGGTVADIVRRDAHGMWMAKKRGWFEGKEESNHG